MQYPLPHPHTTIQTPIQSTGPADQKLQPVRCGGVYEWCGLEGTILAMKHVGAVPATGQLEPAIWLGDGCNATTNRTENGWTPSIFKDFLAYLDEEGVRSVAVWTLPFIEMGPPTSNSTCTHWMLTALRDWIGRPSAAPSSRTAVPELDDDDDDNPPRSSRTRLKFDETDSRASVNRALDRPGPGPRVAGVPADSCGNPSTWLSELQSCETWVRTNPLAGLLPLPKPHWGWGFDPGYIDTAGKPAAYHDPGRNQTAATMRALLTDLARITGSLSADIGCSGPDCAATEAMRMKTLVEICTAAMQAHGTRQPQLSIRLSPWYVKFKGGHDPCSTDGEAAELQRLRTSLTHLATLLHDANQAAGSNITFGAILVDSELFSWGPEGGNGQINGDNVDCITRKNELVYNL